MRKNGKRERLFWKKCFGWEGQELGQSFGKVDGGEVVGAGGFRWWGWGLGQIYRDVGQNFFPLYPG